MGGLAGRVASGGVWGHGQGLGQGMVLCAGRKWNIVEHRLRGGTQARGQWATAMGDGVFTCQRAGLSEELKGGKAEKLKGRPGKCAGPLPIQVESRFLRTEPVQQRGEGADSNGKWRIGGEESEEIAVSSGARLANTCAPVDMTGRAPECGGALSG